jgi:hypothetical protein
VNINKIILPTSILVGCIVIAGFYYASEVNKQQSIERQQRVELEEQRKTEEAKTEQAKKEYFADRKTDCLNIYKTESDKWNNIRGWRYDESSDTCYIRAKDPKPKSDAECDIKYPTGDKSWGYLNITDNLLCKAGEFENSF